MNEREQDVLASDDAVVEAARLIVREGDGLPRLPCEALEQAGRE